MKILVSGGQFFADGFAVRRAFNLWEGECRTISFISDEGCGCTSLHLTNGVPVAESPSLKIVDWKRGFEILPSPRSAMCARTERELSVGEKRFVVICQGGDPARLVFSGAITAEIELSASIFDPKITLLSGQREPLLSMQASCKEGSYLLILSLGAEEPNVLLECSGESIVCRGNEVTVRKKYDDLCLRSVTRRYLWQGKGFDRSQEIVCANQHSFMREQSGRLLLEAVFAEDESAANALLSPEIAEYAAIKEYFGKIVRLVPALFSDSPTAYAALKRNGERWIATTYDFDFDAQGLVTNIRCDD